MDVRALLKLPALVIPALVVGCAESDPGEESDATSTLAVQERTFDLEAIMRGMAACAPLAMVLLALCAAGCATLGDKECGLSTRIEETVRSHMAERRIPGASIGVVTDEGVLHLASYGIADIQHQAPAAVDTVYEIASLTKQFTAAAVLLLCDEGRLTLEDPITQFIDDAPVAWTGITLRHLLSRTAGFPPSPGSSRA